MSAPENPTDPRLERLGDKIEELEERLDEQTGEGDEPKFIDRGKYGPVDDNIAPPG